MKYLDENIEYTVTGLAVPSAGTYYYKVYQDGDVIFYGNTFLNSGDTEKTFDITDIVANQKWKGSLVTPLSDKNEKVNVIQRYKVGLLINGGEESGQYIDVALIYRYPNRKGVLEAPILDMDSINRKAFVNCLQGVKNGEDKYLPHIPYKSTSQYAFGAVFEYGFFESFSSTVQYNYNFDGQLYSSGITAIWSGATTQNLRTMETLYSSANTSYKYVNGISVASNSWTKPSTTYSPNQVYFANTASLSEQPTAIRVCTGTNGTIELGRFLFVNGKVHVSLDGIPQNGRFFIKHNSGADNTNYLRFGTTSWNNITYPVHIEFDATLASRISMVDIRNLQFSRGNAYSDITYLDVSELQERSTVMVEEILEGVTTGECVSYLQTLGYTNAEASDIINRIEHTTSDVVIFKGTPNEASEVYSEASSYFDAYVESDTPVVVPQHTAIVDVGCLPKYYLLWQDRYGGYQSQAFDKVDTFSIDYGYEEMKNYQNARRNISVDVNPKWKIQTDWLDEDVYPIYESIFVSPYLVLYDTEEDKAYNVMLIDKKYTEKNWENQHKFFNLQLNLELNKAQHIIY